MNHTTNYNLNQWEASDRVQRADFNADNAKIDAAIKAVDQRVTTVSATKCEIVAGAYTGNGAASQNINLGRRPKAVYVCSIIGTTYEDRFCNGGLAVSDSALRYNEDPIVTVTDTGFTVHYHRLDYICINTNYNGSVYHYIAFF